MGYSNRTPSVDELATCVPRDRNYAFYSVQQRLVYGNMQKITVILWTNIKILEVVAEHTTLYSAQQGGIMTLLIQQYWNSWREPEVM